MANKNIRSTLVYSTDPEPAAEPEPASYPSASSQTARVSRDRKGRNGKTVTIVAGLRHDQATFAALLKSLKQRCGAGGALKDDQLEIQGDHREQVMAALTALGYKVKAVGG